jgi:hypothetical protein
MTARREVVFVACDYLSEAFVLCVDRDPSPEECRRAIELAARSVEAFLHDVEVMAGSDVGLLAPKRVRDLAKTSREARSGVRKRIRATYKALAGDDLRSDREEWAAYCLLVDIRNELTHPSPRESGTLDDGEDVGLSNPLVSRLHKFGVLEDWHCPLNLSACELMSRLEVAAWSFNTALGILYLVCDAIPDCVLRDMIVPAVKQWQPMKVEYRLFPDEGTDA